jgi:hypothetical protein
VVLVEQVVEQRYVVVGETSQLVDYQAAIIVQRHAAA